MSDTKNTSSEPTPALCKICGGPIPEKRDTHGPFCSERCRLNDLSKWFGENYRIAGRPATRATEPEDIDDE
jgi:endogenous inhibitor of DNA gyrase (YacG/DUF329 family)